MNVSMNSTEKNSAHSIVEGELPQLYATLGDLPDEKKLYVLARSLDRICCARDPPERG